MSCTEPRLNKNINTPICNSLHQQQGPLFSTGNCVQHPVINHNGKEYEKVNLCMDVYVCSSVTLLYRRN